VQFTNTALTLVVVLSLWLAYRCTVAVNRETDSNLGISRGMARSAVLVTFPVVILCAFNLALRDRFGFEATLLTIVFVALAAIIIALCSTLYWQNSCRVLSLLHLTLMFLLLTILLCLCQHLASISTMSPEEIANAVSFCNASAFGTVLLALAAATTMTITSYSHTRPWRRY
jgi:hypothetical protein